MSFVTENYVTTHVRPNGTQWNEDGTIFRENILLLNDEVLPNAPYFTITWYCSAGDPGTDTHTHDFDEYLGFASSDPYDPRNLDGEVDFTIAGEEVVITESTILFVPAGVEHCPYKIAKCNRPIIHWSGGNSGTYKQLR